MNEKTVYTCTDQEHDAWVCGKCGYIEVTRRRSDRHGGKYHTNYIVCRRCGKLCYRMRRRREKTI